MTGSKTWYQSNTIRAAIASILAGVSGLIGVSFNEAAFIELWQQLVVSVTAIVAGGAAWQGRVNARSRIE